MIVDHHIYLLILYSEMMIKVNTVVLNLIQLRSVQATIRYEVKIVFPYWDEYKNKLVLVGAYMNRHYV